MSSQVAMLILTILVIFLISIDCRVFYPRFEDPELSEFDTNQIIRNTMKRNRLCLLNAGLSQGCDLSDMLAAKTQANKFMSFAGPGK